VNLLITNTQEEQAHLILLCLRDVANRIVITVTDGSLLSRWSGISAWSRHVDKRYTVPDCTEDWRAGRIAEDNFPAEEAYIRRIEAICAIERIDVIFPSYDAEVLVLSKNRSRLAEQGILAVTPEFPALTHVLDKELTLRAAAAAGFPMPETRVPADTSELREAASQLQPPWVLKPRCNAHGANIRLVKTWAELESAYVELTAIQPRPLMQEYVPASSKRNYYLVVSPALEVVALHSPEVLRYRSIGIRTPCAVVETNTDAPLLQEVVALVKQLGVWGGMTVQTLVDERDGVPKLMELNARFGHNLWHRTEFGINEPLAYLRLAQGQPAGEVPTWPPGVLLLDPLWDLIQLFFVGTGRSLGWLNKALGRTGPLLAEAGAERTPPLWPSLKSDYFGGRRRVTNPLNRGFLSDPLPPLARIGRTILFELMRRRTQAREAKRRGG